MRPTPEQIVAALRCSASPSAVCQREACPYFVKATEEKVRQFLGARMVANMAAAIDSLSGCDHDEMAIDAADLIEELTGGKANGRI